LSFLPFATEETGIFYTAFLVFKFPSCPASMGHSSLLGRLMASSFPPRLFPCLLVSHHSSRARFFSDIPIIHLFRLLNVFHYFISVFVVPLPGSIILVLLAACLNFDLLQLSLSTSSPFIARHIRFLLFFPPPLTFSSRYAMGRFHFSSLLYRSLVRPYLYMFDALIFPFYALGPVTSMERLSYWLSFRLGSSRSRPVVFFLFSTTHPYPRLLFFLPSATSGPHFFTFPPIFLLERRIPPVSTHSRDIVFPFHPPILLLPG